MLLTLPTLFISSVFSAALDVELSDDSFPPEDFGIVSGMLNVKWDRIAPYPLGSGCWRLGKEATACKVAWVLEVDWEHEAGKTSVNCVSMISRRPEGGFLKFWL